MTRSLLLILVLMSWIRSAFGADPSPITLDSIVKTLEMREKALDSFEATGRLYFSDEHCSPDSKPFIEEFMILHKSDGRRENRIISRLQDGSKKMSQWIRDDGKKQYTMFCPPSALDVVESVRIKLTPNSASRNHMGMMPFLNALTPRGVRLSNLVSTGTELDTRIAESGDRIVRMTTQDFKMKIDLELSERHDYQPVRVQFSKGSQALVTEFVNVDGFWFPKHGHFEGLREDGTPYRRCFEVVRLRVNFDPSSDRFGLPNLTNGSLVFNETKEGPNGIFVSGVSKTATRIKVKARQDFQEKYFGHPPESVSPQAYPSTETSRMPDESNLSKWILAIGIGLIVVALVVSKYHAS